MKQRIDVILHYLRNPYGVDDAVLKEAHNTAADLLEKMVGAIPAYEPEPRGLGWSEWRERQDIAEKFDDVIDEVMDANGY
jgi:hypothetical protein